MRDASLPDASAPDSDAELADLRRRHAAFWRREPADRPLLRVGTYVPLQPNPDVPLRGGRRAAEGDYIVPAELDLDRVLQQWPAPTEVRKGDFLREAVPYGLCWMEGLIGARVRAASGSIWSEPTGLDWADVASLRARLGAGNLWHDTLREYVRRLVEQAAGRVPVAPTLMRGPIDMVQSVAGSESLALAVHDHPAELEAALTTCADAFLQVGRLVPELAPPFADGYSAFGIWAPGTVIRLQADYSAILSPATYRERVAHHERRIAAAFDYSIFHLHSGCVHILDALLEIEPLDAIQVSLDPWPAGPRLGALLPALARVQPAGKALLITGGPVSQEELDRALALLPPRGLALQVQIGSTWG